MNKIFLLAIFIILCFSSSCREDEEDCLAYVLIDHIRTPEHVDNAINKYLDVDTISFMNAEGNEAIYVIKNRIHKTLFVVDEQEVSCPLNDDTTVDIDLNSEETVFSYETVDGLNLTIAFKPDNSAILDPYNQEQLDNLNPVYRFNYSVELPNTRSPVTSSGRAMWENPETIELFRETLNSPLALNGITYDDVSFWRFGVFGPPKMYYLENYEVVGAVRGFNELWIRK